MSFIITNQSVSESIRIAAAASNWQQAYQLAITVTVHFIPASSNYGDSALYSCIFAPKNIQANLTHTALS